MLAENRPGAGGNVGSEYVAKGGAGRLHVAGGDQRSQAIAPHVFKLKYDNQKDLTPVAMVANVPYMMVVHPSLPARNVRELVNCARRQAGLSDCHRSAR